MQAKNNISSINFDPETYTYDEMLEEDGIYICKGEDCLTRFIVVSKMCLYINETMIAKPIGWRNRTFIKTNETISITIQ